MRKQTLFITALGIIILIFAARPITDPDFWWHLKTGEIIFTTHHVPLADIFSFSLPGGEWVTHEWLSELFIFTIYKLGGFGTLIFVFAVIVCGTFGIAFRTAIKRGSDVFVSGLVVLMAAAATLPVWGIRPQIISMFLTAVFVSILFEYTAKRTIGLLWPLPVLTLVWVNLHASFALGLGLIVLTGIAIATEGLWERIPVRSIVRKIVPLVFLFFVSSLIVLVNPSGYKLLIYPFQTLASQMMQAHIEEWLSPDFHQARFLPLLALMLTSVVALAISPKRPRVSDLVFLAAGMFAALRSGRHVPLFAIIAVPILSESISALLMERKVSSSPVTSTRGEGDRSPLRIGFVLIAMLIFAVHFRLILKQQPDTEASLYPIPAIEMINATHGMDRVFNWYDWGGYMIWKLYPNRRVFIDGRADVYGDKLFEQFLNTCNGQPGWDATLKQFNINTVLIKPETPLASLLRQSNDWHVAFEDKQAVVFSNLSSTSMR